MKQIEKIAKTLNDDFKARCDAAFKEKFGVEIKTSLNFLDGNLVSVRTDEKPMTPEQFHWLSGFSDGYADAMNQVRAVAEKAR